jgi:hypothetical protein
MEGDVIFVLSDDDCIHVYESVEDVVRSIEGLDAEESIRAAFDENGQPHKVEWIEANHYGRSFLGFRSVGSGRYTLVPSGPADPRALFALLERDRPVFVGQAIVDADALIARLRQRHG